MRSCFLSSFIEFRSAFSEKSKMSQPIRGQGHLVFLISPKKKNKLGRRRWDLASCQVSLNSVKRFQRRSRNVSANQRPGRLSCFSDQPKKHKLGRGHWDLASCQVSLNSVLRRSRKCLKKNLHYTPSDTALPTPGPMYTLDVREIIHTLALTLALYSIRHCTTNSRPHVHARCKGDNPSLKQILPNVHCCYTL